RLGEDLDAVVGAFEAAHHALQPERVAQPLRHLRPWSIRAVEGSAQILEVLRAIRLHAAADRVEDVDRQAAGIRPASQHHRRDRVARNIIWSSYASAPSGQPWLNTIGCPLPRTIRRGDDERHRLLLWCENYTLGWTASAAWSRAVDS